MNCGIEHSGRDVRQGRVEQIGDRQEMARQGGSKALVGLDVCGAGLSEGGDSGLILTLLPRSLSFFVTLKGIRVRLFTSFQTLLQNEMPRTVILKRILGTQRFGRTSAVAVWTKCFCISNRVGLRA